MKTRQRRDCERKTKMRTARAKTTGTKQGLDEGKDDEDDWDNSREVTRDWGKTPQGGSGIRGYRIQSLYII